MNAATHTDVNIYVCAAVCTMPAVPGVTAAMTTVATTAMTLRFRRRGCTQHHNRCSDRGDAIGPGKAPIANTPVNSLPALMTIPFLELIRLQNFQPRALGWIFSRAIAKDCICSSHHAPFPYALM